MNDDLHQQVSVALADAAREAFARLREQTGETFFSYVLCFHDGNPGFGASANSWEAHAKTLKAAGVEPGSPAEAAYQWEPDEWIHEWIDIGTNELHEDIEDLADSFGEKDDWEQFCIGTLVSALAMLVDEGFFGLGDELDQITLFVWIIDSEATERVANKTGAVLNSPRSAAAFARRYALADAAELEREQRYEALRARVQSLPPAEQMQCWLEHARQMATGDVRSLDEEEEVAQILGSFGPSAVLPMIRLILELLERRPPVRTANEDLFIQQLRHAIPPLVVDGGEYARCKLFIAQRHLAHIKGYESYASIAITLWELYEGYPEPELGELKRMQNGDAFEEAVRARMAQLA